ncbi:MAG: tetratricopeptide repeat protein [bacterium]|nr:tetratricopeptide repeat protein [bacterium]
MDTEKNLKLHEEPEAFFGVYNLGKELWKTGSIQLKLEGANERSNFKRDYTLPLNTYVYNRNLNILYKINEKLNPDYYDLHVILKDKDGNTLATNKVQFSVSPVKTFAYPIETFKKMRVDNPFHFYYILGVQYDKSGNLAKAEEYFSKALESKPEFLKGYVAYLSVLNKGKQYDRVLREVEKINGNEELEFDYNLAKATALYGQKNYEEALKFLAKANTIYDSDLRVLNLLGFTFLNLNEYDEALKVFEASLRLSPNQKFIKKTVGDVKKIQLKKKNEKK